MGTVNFFDKKESDKLAEMGFHYTVHKINANQIVYSFVDTPELRERIVGKYDKCAYYMSKNIYL